MFALAAVSLAPIAPASPVTQTNLVSDIPGLAAVTDPALVNPWGVSFAPTSPFWISDTGSGVSTLYNGAGKKAALTVTVPGSGGGPGTPTGQVFNGTGAFNGDLFIFAGLDGLITGWRKSLGTSAEVLANNSASGAVYTGITLVSTATASYLLAADFHNARIEVIGSASAPALSGHFVDPTLPAGYAPFNVTTIGGQVYVTYAKQTPGSNIETNGAGFGFVSVFSENGTFLKRLASGGALNAPWGVTKAPAGWGSFGNDLLVGNLGDGTIHAYDSSGSLVGALLGPDNKPLVNSGLWDLTFGNGASGGSKNSLYFTAGLDGQTKGLFGRVDPVPEPATWLLLVAGAAVVALRLRRSDPQRSRSGA